MQLRRNKKFTSHNTEYEVPEICLNIIHKECKFLPPKFLSFLIFKGWAKTSDIRKHYAKFRSAPFCIMCALTSAVMLRGASHNSCLCEIASSKLRSAPF